MINCTNADKLLRTVYLDAVANQINTTTSPFFNMVNKGCEDIAGKEVVCPTRIGINGGIGCASDDANLPVSGTPMFMNLRAPIVNVFGNIEITDKVLRASATSAGSFVNVLNSEMESLVDAAKFNFGRMLFQDGSGLLAKIVGNSSGVASNQTTLYVDDVKNFIEGMVIDVVKNGAVVSTGHRVTFVDRVNKTVKVDGVVSDLTANNILTLQGSFKAEMYGLPYIFQTSSEQSALYGNSRALVSYVLPTSKSVGSVTTDAIQTMLDDVEERCGNDINLIIASYDMRRKYLAALQSTRSNIDYLNLDGGFRTLSYNGIPVYADRFVKENTMYFVNTNDFKLQQLADWSWIEGSNGKILRQLPNKAAYGATLVKYANLICIRPVGQARMLYDSTLNA